MKKLLYIGVVVLTPFTLGPAAASAQALAPASARPPVELRTAEQLGMDLDRSTELYREARSLEAASDRNRLDAGEWVRAAEMYLESAERRPYGDVQAYLALNRAATIFARAGMTKAAREAHAAAGARALECGRVYDAGLAFANAAELSQERRESRLALDYLHMAHRLSESPLLSGEEQRRIRTRVGLGEGRGMQ